MNNNAFVLVANMGEDNIWVYDRNTMNLVEKIMLYPIGNKMVKISHFNKGPVVGPECLCYYRKKKLVLIANAYDDSLSVYNLEKKEIECTIFAGRHPNQIAVVEDLDRAFVTNYDSDSVSVIDLSVPEIIGQIPCGEMPQSLFLDKHTCQLYVASGGSNYISIIDCLSLDKKDCMGVDGYPVALAADIERRRMYVMVRQPENYSKMKLVEYHLPSGKTERSMDIGRMPVSILYDGKREMLYIIDALENNLKMISLQHFWRVKTISLGSMPLGQCIDTSGKNLFVVCTLDNSLYLVDIQEGKKIKKVATGIEPVSVVCTG